MRRSGFDTRPWNAVAMVHDGRSASAVEKLALLGDFRPTPYRRVLVGSLAGDAVERVAACYRDDPSPFGAVTRLIPLEATVEFERDDVTEALCVALAAYGHRVAARSFHVRARLRGLKGRVETQAVERALGGYMLELAETSGRPACVSFSDPDVILAVEVIGKRVGYGFLGREVRSVPVVRPR